MSYAGPVALSDENRRFRVAGLHAFTSNITLGQEYSALVRLFRGELWWDIFYLDSDMGPDKAQEIAGEMRRILELAVSFAD